MAIGNRTATSGDIASNTTTTTITKPTGTTSTDILIAVFGNDDNGHATAFNTTAPSGWTQIGTTQNASISTNGIKLFAFWALGSVSSLGFTNSGTATTQGWLCQAFTGVDTTTPIDATGTGNTSTTSASITAGAVTVATAGAWELIAYADWLGGTVTATGFTVATNAGANAQACLLYNTTGKSTGSTGTVSVSNTATPTASQFLAAQPFALRPASAGGATAYPAAALIFGC